MGIKVFMDKNKMATFSCPECKKIRQMDVSQFYNIVKEVKLKYTCTCKHKISVILERRQFFREKVYLEGCILKNLKKYAMMVVDISRFGLKIELIEKLELKVGEKIHVEFILDNLNRSKIYKGVIVRTVSSKEIGVQFESSDHYDKFGPYLLFHFS
ncbi:hypothetical protein HRM2_12050 [Desulforapulum autotrophicum HRM2]|uniref:PilZ domain-containing protein n=2 Tax=Desulforapulum autotrophicum TaxID=2296 RepID=C0QM11_DESAH|nr:hypothetical protein HRM2_12050 [Desulforapulum autotrophicum HRM2]